MRKEKKPLLTEKQELFAVEYILNGGNAAQAYRDTYNVKANTEQGIYVDAHKVLHNPKVSLRVHELQMQAYSPHVISVIERKKLLSMWAKDGDKQALDILNKMESIYTEKVDMNLSMKVIDPFNDD